MNESVLFYLWWVLVNCCRGFLSLDFVAKSVGISVRRILPTWLCVTGAVTLLVTKTQIPCGFFLYTAMLLLFIKAMAHIRWSQLAAPVMLLLILDSVLEGFTALLLSRLSTTLHLPADGWGLQIFVTGLEMVLFGCALQLCCRNYGLSLQQTIPTQLARLLVPGTFILLTTRYSLRLDTRIFERYLSSLEWSASLLIGVIIGEAALLFFILLRLYCDLTEQNTASRLLQEALGRNRQYSSFQHDISNHLLVASGLLKERNYEAAEQYLNRLHNRAVSIPKIPTTGRLALDTLLQEKSAYAKEYGIQFTWNVRIPEDFGVDEIDLCALFANILDNAIHASLDGPMDERRISLNTRLKGNFLMVETINRAFYQKEIRPSTGLYNIRQIANRYTGTVQTILENGEFRISVLLCVP